MQTITSILAADLLEKENNTTLIDVRTQEEWDHGYSKLHNKKPILLSLYIGAERIFNDNFVEDFKLNNLDKNTTLLFICKSGGRSAKAAELISKLGYTKSINIIDGFEGWKNSNLPIETKL